MKLLMSASQLPNAANGFRVEIAELAGYSLCRSTPWERNGIFPKSDILGIRPTISAPQTLTIPAFRLVFSGIGLSELLSSEPSLAVRSSDLNLLREMNCAVAQALPLSLEGRVLTIEDIRGLDEAQAFQAFRLIRWPDTHGRPVCPRCSHEECWEIRRRCFKCSACRREFSATAGTVFASRKMNFKDILAAMWLASDLETCRNPHRLSHALGCEYKTGVSMFKKLRQPGSLKSGGRENG
jgi:hypothetical protein